MMTAKRYRRGWRLIGYGVVLATPVWLCLVVGLQNPAMVWVGPVLIAPYLLAAVGSWLATPAERHWVWACSRVVLAFGFFGPLGFLALAAKSGEAAFAPLIGQYLFAACAVFFGVLGRIKRSGPRTAVPPAAVPVSPP